jgi:hypothetical protein
MGINRKELAQKAKPIQAYIPGQDHDRLKSYCKENGILLRVFLQRLVLQAIHKLPNGEGVSK